MREHVPLVPELGPGHGFAARGRDVSETEGFWGLVDVITGLPERVRAAWRRRFSTVRR